MQTSAADVLERIESVQRSQRREAALVDAARLFASGLLLAALIAVADYFLELATPVRLLSLLAAVTFMGWSLVRLVRRSRAIQASGAAAAIESTYTPCGQSVRTTLDYASHDKRTAPASAELVAALVSDTELRTRDVDLPRVVSYRNAWLGLAAFLGIAAICLTTLIRVPESWISAGRVLLLPLQYTQLTVTSPDEPLPAGQDATIGIRVTGRPVDNVLVRYRHAGVDEPWNERPLVSAEPADDAAFFITTNAPGGSLALIAAPQDGARDQTATPDPGPVRFAGETSVRFADLQHSTEFYVVAGSLRSDHYRIEVLQPLEMEQLEVSVFPPGYTRLEPETSDSPNVKVIEGSDVAFEIRFNRHPFAAELHRIDPAPAADSTEATTEESTELRIAGNVLTWRLPALQASQQFVVSAQAADDMRFESPRFRVHVQPDGKPRIRFIKPPEQMEATPTTEVAMAFDAEDDFGIRRLGVAMQVAGGELQTLWETKFDASQPPTETGGQAVLYLEDFSLNFPDAVTYYAFVEDNRPDAAGRTATELHFIDIRPYKREFQFAEGGSCNACSLALEELIARQRANLRRTFAANQTGDVPAAVIRRLATTQRELHEATSEFTLGAMEFGPVPALEDAVDAMQSALEQLETRDAVGAQASEEIAVASLIRARENLRKKLSNSSSSASQCRTFDQQQVQKLRRPPQQERQQEQDQQQQTAQLREQLDQLAQQQREWSDQVRSGSSPVELETQPQPVDSQQQAAQEQALARAESLRDELDDSQAASELARQRMAETIEAMRQSLAALADGQPRQSAESARSAADQLSELSEHLAALNAADFAARLAAAEQLADAAARQQRALSSELHATADEAPPAAAQPQRPSLSQDQHTIANATERLADLLDRASAAALDEERATRDQLAELKAANPANRIAGVMHQAADEIESGALDAARSSADAASSDINQLAASLRTLRKQVSQPRLDELVAAEQGVAELQSSARQADDAASQALVDSRAAELQRRLDQLARHDSRLARALADARDLATSGQTTPNSETGGPGGAFDHLENQRNQAHNSAFHPPPTLNGAPLSAVARALQQRIQEVILASVRADSDDNVPAAYRELVERYYRELSDDLR